MADRKEFKRGREAGRRWAIGCEPAERHRFWKNRAELGDADYESVYDAIFSSEEDEDVEFGEDEWEARCAEFWGTEVYGDPPSEDYVRGFVAGARAIVSKVAVALKEAARTPVRRKRASPPKSKQKTRR